MEHKGTVRLETERLVLRQFVRQDATTMFINWCSDPRVTAFLRWPAHEDISVTEAVLQKWIENYGDKTFYQWAIVLKETAQAIGTISVVGMDERTDTLHIGYCIGYPWWHCGYTSEAFQRVISFLFEEIGAQRIESQHDPNNPRSGKVMQKCGLRYEGTLRKADWSNQGIVDACMYALLREEYSK